MWTRTTTKCFQRGKNRHVFGLVTKQIGFVCPGRLWKLGQSLWLSIERASSYLDTFLCKRSTIRFVFAYLSAWQSRANSDG